MEKVSLIGKVILCSIFTIFITQSATADIIERGGPDLYGNVITLEPQGQTSFTTNFGNSIEEFKSLLYAAAGVSGQTGKCFVEYVQPGRVDIGDSNWQFGGIAIHFHSDVGFAGGEVTLRYNHRGSSDYIYWAIGTEPPTSDDGWQHFTTISGTPTYFEVDWGAGIATLPIPAGNDIYVVINKPGPSKSEYLVCQELSFNPIFIPEPATPGLVILGIGLWGIKRRKPRL